MVNEQLDNVLENVVDTIGDSIRTGFQTLRESIEEFQRNSGTQTASAFEVQVNHGPTRVVISDADPILNEQVPAGAQVTISKIQSADAGRV